MCLEMNNGEIPTKIRLVDRRKHHPSQYFENLESGELFHLITDEEDGNRTRIGSKMEKPDYSFEFSTDGVVWFHPCSQSHFG